MDKRKIANIAVKKKITDALFSLMGEKNLTDITVTEVIKKAGVARASFYRNYSTKENVLSMLIDDALAEYVDDREPGAIEYKSKAEVMRTFKMFSDYSSYIENMYKCGHMSVLIEKLNRFHELVAGSMPNGSIERYYIYIYMGALYNTALVWIKNGKKESLDQIAEYFYKTMAPTF